MNTETIERPSEVINIDEKTTLGTLYSMAEEIQKHCKDFTVRGVCDRNLRFYPESGSIRFVPENGDMTEYKLTQHSLGQLCTKLEVPVRYIEKCIKKGQIDLASDNVNSWIADHKKDLFIRTYKNQARGILSNRYMTLDAPDIISTLDEVLPQDQFKVKGSFLTPERFHARIVDRNQILKSEDLFAGVQVDSSDVGRSTLTVTFFIYKQICTNGLIAPVQGGILYSQKHLGRSQKELEEFRTGFKTAMEKLPEIAGVYSKMIEKAKNKKVVFYPEISGELKNSLADETGLSEEALDKVFKIREEKYPSSQWGFINAVTEVAQDYTLERRIEIEKAAGNMLMRVA